MRRTSFALALTGLVIGATFLSGCSSPGGDAAPPQKIIEHTSSTPPPGILERQQQQSQAMERASKSVSGER